MSDEATDPAAGGGESASRAPGAHPPQPLHTVYGGVHLFQPETCRRLGERALDAMETYALDAPALAGLLGIGGGLAARVLERVRRKLREAPVEDYRIDFEDGYGLRPDAEEDGHARAAGHALRIAAREGLLPRWIGVRTRGLGEATRPRAERTLRLVLGELLADGPRVLPPGFLVTLPKVARPEPCAFAAALLSDLEREHGLPAGWLRLELMVEMPEALFDADGRAALPGLVRAGAGRVIAAHFGAYDYTAALGIGAASQRLRHPACDWARSAMQVQLAGTGVWLADGATATLPVGPHRGDSLTAEQRAENQRSVHAGWRLHAEDVRHGLEAGFYQGWDLHPAQLVSRYAAVHAFFLEGFESAAARLRNFLDRAARATRVGTSFDDAATAQGLLNYFRRALTSGALEEDEVRQATGLSTADLQAHSFAAPSRERWG